VPVHQAPRTGPVRLATGYRGDSTPVARRTLDAPGRHRLAPSGAHLAANERRL